MTWLVVTGLGLVAETVVIVALASGVTARYDAERWGLPPSGGGASDPSGPPAAIEPGRQGESRESVTGVRLDLAG